MCAQKLNDLLDFSFSLGTYCQLLCVGRGVAKGKLVGYEQHPAPDS